MTVSNDPKVLGTWKASPYQVTLYDREGQINAEVKKEKEIIHLSPQQIKWGILEKPSQGDLLHPQTIERIDQLGKEKIAVWAYPKQSPTEIWIFEASKMAGLQIRQAKEHLRAAKTPEETLAFYQKALKNFENALKMQEKIGGNLEELKEAIETIKREILLARLNQDPKSYLPSHEEVESFQDILKTYQDEENFLECLEELLSVIEDQDYEPHHLLLAATVHESKKEFLEAAKQYIALADEKNPYALNCIEKAYALLEQGKEKNLQDCIRMRFEKMLEAFSKSSPQDKEPTCFICFNVEEKDVGKWLEETFVPDLDRIGVKPIFCFRDLSHGQDLDNLQELARSTDQVIIA